MPLHHDQKPWQLIYLKGVEVFGHNTAKLGIGVLLGLFVVLQGFLDASPQDDHHLQQAGHNGRVFHRQNTFNLPR